METWKSHVRVKLFHRDCMQKDPFSGLFNTVSRLEKRLELKSRFWEDTEEFCANDECNPKTLREENIRLQLQVKEGEYARQELAHIISDMTSTMYLKDAELQYCHSLVSRYRSEAVGLAKRACSLRMDLSECEFTAERQAKDLMALQQEQRALRKELAVAHREKEELLDRWMLEKTMEAERINKHNAMQERWHRFACRLNKYLSGGAGRAVTTTSSLAGQQVIQTVSAEQQSSSVGT